MSLEEFVSDMAKCIDQKRFSDVEITFGDAHFFYGHKVILSNRSAFFEEIFKKEEYSQKVDFFHFMKEGTFQSSSLKVVFDYLYAGTLDITERNVLDVYEICIQMKLKHAENLCNEFIESMIGRGSVCGILLDAQKRGKESLFQACMRAIEKNTEDAMDSDDFLLLPEEMVVNLLKKENLSCTEKGLFEGVCRWWCAHKDDILPGRPKTEQDRYLLDHLLYYVRYPIMSSEELMEIEKMKLLPESFILQAFRHHACGDFSSTSLGDDDHSSSSEKNNKEDAYKDESFRTKVRGEFVGFSFDETKIGEDIVLSKSNTCAEISKANVTAYQCCCGSRILDHGLHFWEVDIENSSSTSHIMIGIANEQMKLQNNWVGKDEHGWSWFGYNGTKYNKGTSPTYGTKFFKDDVIGVKLDLRKNGRISFYLNGVPQGIAFDDLKESGKTKRFIAAVSLRNTGDKVRIRTKNLKFRNQYKKFISTNDK